MSEAMRLVSEVACILLLAFGVNLAAVGLCEAQVHSVPTRVIGDPPASELGEVALSLAVRLGESGPGAGPLGRIAISPDSSILAVTDVFNPDQVNLYSSTGEHLRTLGGRGDGPGEFQNVMWVTAVADSVFVYDNVHARETLYTFDGTYHRSRRMVPNLWRAVPFAGGRTVVNAYDPAAARAGAPLHVVVEGRIVTAFPPPERPFDGADRPLLRRALAAESDSTLWMARRTEYGIELWSITGAPILRLERDVDWFVPHEDRGAILPDAAPRPRVWDLHRSPEGLLWVLLHVADERWQDQFDPARPADMSFTGHFHEYRNSIVEVIDPEDGRLVASREFDLYFSGFTSAGHLATYHEPIADLPYIEVFSVSLRQP